MILRDDYLTPGSFGPARTAMNIDFRQCVLARECVLVLFQGCTFENTGMMIRSRRRVRMAKQEWAVRVVWFLGVPPRTDTPGARTAEARQMAKFDMLGSLLEQLRRMGHARQLAHLDAGQPTERLVFEFYCPKGLDSKVWAEGNSERMKTFGYNAVAAPVWGQRLDLPEGAREQGLEVKT
jgi:hypothetical protein